MLCFFFPSKITLLHEHLLMENESSFLWLYTVLLSVRQREAMLYHKTLASIQAS